MKPIAFTLVILMAASAGAEVVRSGEPQTGDSGWFRYDPPQGWARRIPSIGVTYPPTIVEFAPSSEDLRSAPRLEIRDVTDQKSRTERVAALYEYSREREWRHLASRAKERGAAPPRYENDRIPTALQGPGQKQSLSLVIERDGQVRRQQLHFVELLDGRRFRVRYSGSDPAFEKHREAVTASLASLSFAPAGSAQPAVTIPEAVAFLKKHLDGDRLWLYDGQVAGRRLTDEHLVALKEPAFAGVTDLNLISGHAAALTGVDVTDAGLAHLVHLPLRNLCLRGTLVTDAGLVRLKDLRLESLVLAETLVKGEGLRYLADMPLKAIDLANTRIGDESIQHLVEMPLVYVNLQGTRVTEDGLEKFRQQHPDAAMMP